MTDFYQCLILTAMFEVEKDGVKSDIKVPLFYCWMKSKNKSCYLSVYRLDKNNKNFRNFYYYKFLL
jgi:hypothetical protein